MSLVSYELIMLILTIFIVIILKLNKKFYYFILKGTLIYLPPNDNDYQLIINLKKSKDSKNNAIIRSCDIKEYIEKSHDQNIVEVELILFFYITSFINLINIEILKILKINNNDDTISASFCLITLIYIIYSLFKNTFKNGYSSYNAMIFYSLFIFFMAISGLIVFFNHENLFVSIDYVNICKILNDRYERVLIQSDTINDHILCNNTILKLFYIFIFSLISGLLYRPCARMAHFDNLLISDLTKLEKIDESLVFRTKIKIILSTSLLFIFIKPLLQDHISISFNNYMLFIIPAFLIYDMYLNSKYIKQYSNVYLLDNYRSMIEFCKSPDDLKVNKLRNNMKILNENFWSIFLNLIYLTFLPILTYTFYISRSNFIQIGMKNKIDAFLESITYIYLLCLIIGKSIISLGYIFFSQSIKNNTFI